MLLSLRPPSILPGTAAIKQQIKQQILLFTQFLCPLNRSSTTQMEKSLLRAEDQVPSKLEGPVAAAHDSCNLLQRQGEGTLCSSTCELASEVLTTPKPAISPTTSCAKWEIWELATSQTEEHHSNNLNSCCFFDPRGHRSHLLARCGRQSCTLRKPLYQVSDLNWPVIRLSEERMFLT